LRERVEAGDLQGVVESLEGVAAVALARHQWTDGVTMLATASAWRRDHGVPLIPALQERSDRDLAQARLALLPNAFEQAWTQGEALAIDQAIDLAYGLVP
jgi:hypothetical protein